MKFRFSSVIHAPLILFFLGYSALFITIPFLLHSVFPWDMEGHRFNVWLARQHFPNIYYWNPFFFLGYDQFTSYPPMFTWITTLLSFIFGIDLSFRLVVVLSWVATPISLYFFVRSFLGKVEAFVACSIILFFFAYNENAIGANVRSIFSFGNVANSLVMPPFFFLMGALARKHLRTAVALFAFIVLSHFVAALVSFSVVFFILFHPKNLRPILTVFLLGIGISAFWLIPFLHYSYGPVLVQRFFTPFSKFDYVMLALNLVNGSFVVWRKWKNKPIPNLVLRLFYFSIINFCFANLFENFTSLANHFPFHYERCRLYNIVAIPLSVYFLRQYLDKKTLYVSAMILCFVSASIGFQKTSSYYKNLLLVIPKVQNPNGRTLYASNYQYIDSDFFFHTINSRIAEQGQMVAKGLFAESSINTGMVFDLEQLLLREGRIFDWGTVWSGPPPADLPLSERLTRIATLSQLLGVNQLVSENSLHLPPDSRLTKKEQGYDTYALKNELVEKAPLKIEFRDPSQKLKDWHRFIYRQWIHTDLASLPVQASPIHYSESGKAQLLTHDPLWNSLKISVQATSGVIPVLVHFSESPKWKAIANGGGELTIYRAAPSQILVFTDKSFELRYDGFDRFSKVSALISITALLIFLCLGRKRKMNLIHGR